MVNKKHLQRFWTKIRPVSYWYFLIAFVISLSISVIALRQNNLHMVKLREAVYKTDEQNGDIETSLRNLREYIYSHMNTDLSSGNASIKPPIQLKYHYERLIKAEQSRVTASNVNVYSNAQNSCQAQFPKSTSEGPGVTCILDYIASHSAKEQKIDDSMYKFDFVSPVWSPDLAGWSLIATALLLLIFLLRFGLERWARAVLQSHD